MTLRHERIAKPGRLTVVQITLGPIPNTHSGQIHLFLYGKINPDETKYTVKSMKIELVLKKDTPGKWPTLRKKNSELVDNLALVSFPQPSFNQFHTYVNSLGYASVIIDNGVIRSTNSN